MIFSECFHRYRWSLTCVTVSFLAIRFQHVCLMPINNSRFPFIVRLYTQIICIKIPEPWRYSISKVIPSDGKHQIMIICIRKICVLMSILAFTEFISWSVEHKVVTFYCTGFVCISCAQSSHFTTIDTTMQYRVKVILSTGIRCESHTLATIFWIWSVTGASSVSYNVFSYILAILQNRFS